MTATISRPIGNGQTEITDVKTGATIRTDVSPEFGGGGSTFSSTDLVGAGLGSCISSSLAALAERNDIDLADISIEVDKELGTDPKRIVKLAVTIRVGAPYTEKVSKVFERAAHTCTVHRSLHPDIDAPITIKFEG